MSTRERFLRSFLGALGARELVIREVRSDRVSGTVIYDPNDPEERQDFCWDATDSDVPDASVCRLADLLHEEKLLDIDKIRVSVQHLRERYNARFEQSVEPAEFRSILDALECVTVRMIEFEDDLEGHGLRDAWLGDAYFIHE